MNDGPRIAVVDIETLPMLAYTFSLFKPVIGIDQIKQQPRIAGIGWSWVGENEVYWWSEFDMGRKNMLNQVRDALNRADIVVGWNSKSFDYKWLRAEIEKEQISPASPCLQVDLMREAKKNFFLPSYKLDYTAREFLGVGKKHSTGGFPLWIACCDGDPKAWNRMGRYCVQDVRITKRAYGRLLPHLDHPHSGLWTGEDCCRNCKSRKLERRGFTYTADGKFQRIRCLECGKWDRSRKRAFGTINLERPA